MKLFITRDVSPSDVCFLIRDELGRDKYTAVTKRRKRSMRGVVNNIVRLNILDENKNLVARLTTVARCRSKFIYSKNRQNSSNPRGAYDQQYGSMQILRQ